MLANENKIHKTPVTRSNNHGTAERPRLSTFQDSRYIYVQMVDDDNRIVLNGVRFDKNYLNSVIAIYSAAKMVGATIVKTAKAAGISQVIFESDCQFDTGKQFTNALAKFVREGGLIF